MYEFYNIDLCSFLAFCCELTEELHLKPKLSMFCALSQDIINTFMNNYISILKLIVAETQNVHEI